MEMEVEINRPLFLRLCCDAAVQEHERYNIGTYKEKKLHRILKHYFEPNTDYHEVPYGGYIADIKREDAITEIETSGFSGLSDKLSAYLPTCKVNLIYPIPHIKYVAWVDPETGDISKKRRSPKTKGVYEALFEMVRIFKHVTDPGLTVTAVLLTVDDYRMLDGWSKNRKRGSHRLERMPTDICKIIEFKTNADYAAYLPDIPGEDFTASEFAKAAGVGVRYVYGILKVLTARGLVTQIGKRGRSNVYAFLPCEDVPCLCDVTDQSEVTILIKEV